MYDLNSALMYGGGTLGGTLVSGSSGGFGGIGASCPADDDNSDRSKSGDIDWEVDF